MPASAPMSSWTGDPGNLEPAAPTAFARFQRVDGGRGRLYGRATNTSFACPAPGTDRSGWCRSGLDRSGWRRWPVISRRDRSSSGSRRMAGVGSRSKSSRGRGAAAALVNLLYHRLRMAKEVQAHMWISFLERVVRLSGGRMTGGIESYTERIPGGS